MRRPAVLLALIPAVAALVVAAAGRKPLAPARPEGPLHASSPLPSPAPATASPADPVATPAMGIVYPDGSHQPMLNGAVGDVTIDWPADRPFAPVRGRVWHAGTEFYEHTDGTFTTSVVRQDQASGKDLTIGLIYTPVPRELAPKLVGDRGR